MNADTAGGVRGVQGVRALRALERLCVVRMLQVLIKRFPDPAFRRPVGLEQGASSAASVRVCRYQCAGVALTIAVDG
jgi:hypothetical protein